MPATIYLRKVPMLTTMVALLLNSGARAQLSICTPGSSDCARFSQNEPLCVEGSGIEIIGCSWNRQQNQCCCGQCPTPAPSPAPSPKPTTARPTLPICVPGSDQCSRFSQNEPLCVEGSGIEIIGCSWNRQLNQCCCGSCQTPAPSPAPSPKPTTARPTLPICVPGSDQCSRFSQNEPLCVEGSGIEIIGCSWNRQLNQCCCGSCPTPEPTQGPTSGEQPTPGIMGDPHLMAWNGDFFDYMGECDLVLFQVSNFNGGADLFVHVRTTIRYDYSFVSLAAVRIGSDTLEVSSWGDYLFNGVESALTNPRVTGKATIKAGTMMGGDGSHMDEYPIFHTSVDKKNHRFDIVLPNHQNLTISSMKDIVSIKVNHASFESFGGVQGLLGDYYGHMLARDGFTEHKDDINKMAEEWQVRADKDPILFSTSRSPQYPAKCRLPDVATKEARRLREGILEEEAKEACAHLSAKPQLFAACVYDVTATNDLDQANAY